MLSVACYLVFAKHFLSHFGLCNHVAAGGSGFSSLDTIEKDTVTRPLGLRLAFLFFSLPPCRALPKPGFPRRRFRETEGATSSSASVGFVSRTADRGRNPIPVGEGRSPRKGFAPEPVNKIQSNPISICGLSLRKEIEAD